MRNVMKMATIAITVVEVVMILALVGLEFSSGYRAGIMHHLYYQKRSYLATIFPQSLFIYHLLGIAASITIFLFCCRPERRPTDKTPFIRYGAVLLALICCYSVPWFSQLNIFAHLLIVLECCLLLENIRILLIPPPHLMDS
ncbi:hypothetical protein [Desulfopila aestuarii]|uniref:Uncharacterized protein n=1 Tax=Desulfopila aestuarii DSM 18488 TaxID=1121416 RepID=A0A1M7YB75_9BACT|nr:hypothetical protein [Desulfopila aestuarii]SHO49885.1 hypothetical protein SAMN02745220_03133 [Desulfopila aestuarii DSM 18488]